MAALTPSPTSRASSRKWAIWRMGFRVGIYATIVDS